MAKYAFYHEPLTPDLQHEMLSLVNDYYESTPAHDGIPRYDFIWPVYESLGKNVVAVTARLIADKSLVGFVLYILSEHLHHRGLIVAYGDTICTSHLHRGEGVGKALYTFTEPLLIERGVKRIINGYRHVYNAKPMFEGLGFKAEETMYVKRID